MPLRTEFGVNLMTFSELNQHRLALMSALAIEPNQTTDWLQFVQYLADISHAEEVRLSFTRELPARVIQHGQSPTSNGYPLTLSFEEALLSFSFENLEAQQTASAWLLPLQPHLQNCIALGCHHQYLLQQSQQQNLCLQGLNAASWRLSARGEIQQQCPLATELQQQGVIRLQRKLLAFTDEPKWLSEQLQRFSQQPEQVHIAQRHLLHGGQRWIACLIQQPVSTDGWIRDPVRITLLLTPLNEHSTSRWLSEVFELSDSEARIGALFASGLSADQVAALTGYSKHTVYSYIKQLYQVLGINKQSQLTAAIWPQTI